MLNMKYKVTDKVLSKPKYKVFKLKLSFMEGDADGYSYGEVIASTVTDEIKELIKMLDTVSAPYKECGHGGEDCEDEKNAGIQYVLDSSILKFVALSRSTWNGDDEDKANDYLSDLGWDIHANNMFPNSIEGWTLSYFDGDGVEYEVEVL